MFHNRIRQTLASAALCSVILAPAACGKKEEPKPEAAKTGEEAKAGEPAKAAEPAKPAEPVLAPDVELVAGENIAGWISLASVQSLSAAAGSIGGKLGLPAAALSETELRKQLDQAFASAQISSSAWVAFDKPIHIFVQDEKKPAAPAPAADPAKPADPAAAAPVSPADQVANGAVVLLPITAKDAMLTAMATAKKGPDAEGHDAKIEMGPDKAVYIDVVGSYAVLTTDKERFGKAKGFVERISKVTVPGLGYVGLSIEDLVKSRAEEVEGLLKTLEEGAAASPANSNPQMLGMYTKMFRGWVQELARVEFIVTGDATTVGLDVRVTAKEGSKLAKTLSAGKGRTTTALANLLPGNSYFSLASNTDPAPQLETLNETLVILKDAFKMDDAEFKGLSDDLTGVAKLQTGEGAFGAYPDGAAAIGMLVSAGTTDGETALKLTKSAISKILLKVIAMQEAEKAAAAGGAKPTVDPMDEKLKAAIKDMKIDGLLVDLAPMAATKGITLTATTTKLADGSCDVLDIGIDYAKAGMGEAEMAQAKAIVGDKTALALCASKTKMVFAAGPSALEKGKAVASGTAGGLADSAVYKAATEKLTTASMIAYANVGGALAAFKTLTPPTMPTIPADKAVIFSCQNRTKSFGCGFEVPVDLIVAAKNAASAPPPAAPAAPGGEPGAAPAPAPVPAPGPTGGK
jgi:hypothetical protein